LSALGGSENLLLIETFIAGGGLPQGEALLTKMAILSREDPNEALSLMIGNPNSPSKESIADLETRHIELDSDQLIKCLQHEDQGLRGFATKLLANRDGLPIDAALKIIEDQNADLNTKGICYKYLIGKGRTFIPDLVSDSLTNSSLGLFPLSPYATPQPMNRNEILLLVYRNIGYGDLSLITEWFSVEGQIAYQALVMEHFDRVSSQIRSDLADRFKSFQDASLETLRGRLGQNSGGIEERLEPLNDFIRARFISSALSALAEHGNEGDVELARGYLIEEYEDQNWDEVQLEALRIVGKFGTPSDIENVLRIAQNKAGEMRQLASIVALRLSPGAGGAAVDLLQLEDKITAGLAIESLLASDPVEVRPILEPLLDHKDEDIRTKALAYFVKKYNADELVDLMSGYISRPTYYYNVVCWLDRILYAPPPLRQWFQTQLESKLP